MKKKILFSLMVFMIFSSVVLATNYTDVVSNHWAYEAINDLSAKEILLGYPDGTFSPDRPITRAELAKILVLSLNLVNNYSADYKDISPNHWAYDYVGCIGTFLPSTYLSTYYTRNLLS